ncbi:hypothetical protein H0H93_010884 [Arthromyces matolae]|nr:hypothetical protein H0H93_010884 [Arthromyces matolae]
MDFLKKLAINDDDKSSSPAHRPGQGLGLVDLEPVAKPTHGTQHFVDKVSNALNEDKPHMTGVNESSRVHDKILTVLGHSQPPLSHSPAPASSHEGSLVDKFANALGNSSSSHSTSPPKAKEEHLFGKLSNVLGHSTPPPPPPAPKHDGILGKIEGLVGNVTKDKTPAKPQTLSDKINGVLGGGSKGEQDEDLLDKAIDFVQEHVLREGQQKSESAIEQLKDKQIANAIRHQFKSVTGKELPSMNLPGHGKDGK